MLPCVFFPFRPRAGIHQQLMLQNVTANGSYRPNFPFFAIANPSIPSVHLCFTILFLCGKIGSVLNPKINCFQIWQRLIPKRHFYFHPFLRYKYCSSEISPSVKEVSTTYSGKRLSKLSCFIIKLSRRFVMKACGHHEICKKIHFF